MRGVARTGFILQLLLLSGCVTVFGPRFPQNVQASFAREEMRQLTTASLELYYPARRRAEALRIAARVEQCVGKLRRLTVDPTDGERLRVFLTTADFNNAYVQPTVPGVPQQMVLPEHVTLELFNWFGLGPGEVADIGCHEAVHYVQLQQTSGFWRVVNDVTGGLFDPNVLTESWFLEGLATYYEGELGPRLGRPHSPLWRGWFRAGVSEMPEDFEAGYLSPSHRLLLPFGGNYLTGSHFVRWLAERFGEERLWQLVQRQGNSVLSPFGVTLRFKDVYGATIGTLFEDFERDYLATVARRTRPESQRVLAEDVGYLVRMAAGRSGVTATIAAHRERVLNLTLREPDGEVRLTRPLTQLLPFRDYVLADPSLISGLTFSPDERRLYFLTADVDAEGSFLSSLLVFDARTGELLKAWDGLVGLGGSLTPDERHYVFVSVEGDTANLAALSLETGEVRRLTRFEGRSSLGPPAVSPDGARIAFPRWMGEGFDLFVRERDGSLERITYDGRFNYSPRWIDAETLVFLREGGAPRIGTQAYTYTLGAGTITRVTEAPYAVLDPQPTEAGLAILNRDGWHWTLDLARMTAQQREPLVADALREPPSRSRPPPVAIVEDRPYSPLDGLLVPQLRVPNGLGVSLGGAAGFALQGGLSLQGADRLGFHSYLLSLFGSTYAERGPTLVAQYLNAQLAPWFLSASVSRQPSGPFTNLTATVTASRTFWTTPLSFSLIGRRLHVLDGSGGEALLNQFVGPSVSASYFSGDSTPYGGFQRALGLSGSAAYYPRAANAAFDLGDLRATLSGAVPLPFSGRHNLTFSLRGRALPGAPDGLLRVGGFSNELAFSTPEIDRRFPPGPLLLPAGISFSEPLRGYEDFVFRGTWAGIAQTSYRYRFIIDTGWTSFLYLFSSIFIRQVEAEAWGAFARSDGASPNHGAAGGAIYLRTVYGQAAPISLYYQLALRFHEALPPLHTVGLSFE